MSTKEAILDLSGSRRRGSASPKAGSVWESRMKLDEVKGGFKVFNPTHENSQENTQNSTNSTSNLNNNSPHEAQIDKKVNDVVRAPKQSPTGMSGRRRTWKSENSEGSPVQIARQRSELRKNLDQDFKELISSSSSSDGIKKSSPVWIKKNRSSSSSTSDGNHEKNDAVPVKPTKNSSDDDDKKVVVGEPNRDLQGYNGKIDKSPVGGGVQISRSDENCKDKEISVPPKKIVIEDKKLPPPAVNLARFPQTPTKTKPNHFHGIPRSRTNSRLQSFVGLIMWKDLSKSAFIFGVGTFGIISSSYTKDLNISFISVMSYLGLVYLAAIFLFRSLITRGSMDMDSANQDCVVGEEEAVWVVKLVLPYLNEFLLKLRALFSGDPATTMKLAVLLFILARCGISITIWKMAKLGFIGVFTVPKICSTYSSHLTAYGTFWIRRFGDAWESCSHKKAVAFAIFTLVWNLSSIVARIWAVFMLFVAFKYYQRSLIREGWTNEENVTSIEQGS